MIKLTCIMLTKFSFFALQFFTLVTSLSAQNTDKILAEAGNIKIMQSDLRNRLELSPFISNRGSGNRDSLLSDFLYSMIAEKLWYLEASGRGFEQSEEYRFYFQPVEEIFLRDALFKKEIKDKVLLSAQDVQNALEKASSVLKCLVFITQDSALAESFIDSVKSGNHKSPEEILVMPGFNSLRSNTADIRLGTLRDEDAENTLFSLSAGEVSPAFRTEQGYVIFYISDIISSPFSLTDEKAINDIKNTVRERRVFNLTEKYLINLLTPYLININESRFTTVAEGIHKILAALPQAPKGDTLLKPYVLSESDYRNLRASLGNDFLHSEFFRINDQIINVYGFLSDLALSEPVFRSGNRKQVFQKLSGLAKNYVQKKILTSEALRLGLQNDPSVKRDIQAWRENLLSQMLKVSFTDSLRVTDKEAEDYYKSGLSSDKDFLLINLKLVTVQTPEEVEKILKLTDSGVSFDSVAASYGRTDSLVNNLGETGLKPTFLLGEIGRTASALPLNQLYGPVRRDGRYTVFMVTDRKEISDSVKIDFDQNKEAIKNHLFVRKLNRFTAEKTRIFAQKYNAKVYPENLSEIRTTGIKMFVHRLMGFGGRIAGVPLLDNWAEFIDSTELRKVLLP